MIRRVVLVAMAGTLLAACAPQEKQEAVRRIANAVETVGVRTGAISVETRQLDAPQLPVSATPTDVVAPVASLGVIVDRASRRAVLLAPAEAAARIGISEGNAFPALVIFDGDRIYVRAPDASLIGARPWLSMDLSDLGGVAPAVTGDLARPRTYGDLAVVSPIQLLDLALGVLTGSVKQSSASTYRANTSIEKEFRERKLEPSDAEDFEEALSAFALKDDINPIVVKLDGGGLRGVAVDFLGRPEYGVKFSTRFELQLNPVTTNIDKSVLRIPAREDVVEITSFGEIRGAIDEWAITELGA